MIYEFVHSLKKKVVNFKNLSELKEFFKIYAKSLSYKNGFKINFDENKFKTEKYFAVEFLDSFFNRKFKELRKFNFPYVSYINKILSCLLSDKYKNINIKIKDKYILLNINEYKFILFFDLYFPYEMTVEERIQKDIKNGGCLFINFNDNTKNFDVNTFLHEIRD